MRITVQTLCSLIGVLSIWVIVNTRTGEMLEHHQFPNSVACNTAAGALNREIPTYPAPQIYKCVPMPNSMRSY